MEEESSDDVDWEFLDSSPSHLHPNDGGQEQTDFSDEIPSDYFLLESQAVDSDSIRDFKDWPSDESEHGSDGIVLEAVQEVEPEVVVVESNDEGEDAAAEEVEKVESDGVGSNECIVEEIVDLVGSDEAVEVVASDGGDGGGLIEGEDSVVGANGGDGEGEKRDVWWWMPIELIKFYAFRVSPVWSVSIAAAVVGIVALVRRLRSSKPKVRLIPLKVRVEDKVMILRFFFFLLSSALDF